MRFREICTTMINNQQNDDHEDDDDDDDGDLGLTSLLCLSGDDDNGHEDALALRTIIEYPIPACSHSSPAGQDSSSTTTTTTQVLRLGLLGGRGHPLWGHHLWNGARVLADYLAEHPGIVKGKTVLELGAGAGLPGLLCATAASGARGVVLTDYPDADLIGNLEMNARDNEGLLGCEVHVKGYLWGGKDVKLLFDCVPLDKRKGDGFDILLLADLLFNHSCHDALVATIRMTLARQGQALVFFTPYRPWLLDKDMAFFDVCRAQGLSVDKVLERKMERVMFAEDPGDEELRRTVFGFVVRWANT